MRTIIAGSRRLDIFNDHPGIRVVADVVTRSGFRITEVLSGGAAGIDQAGELWADCQSPPIPIRIFLPDWDRDGTAAGPIRNREMAENADALVLIWNGASKGSENMKMNAIRFGLKIHEHIVK